jgi:hypothetical protein
MKSAKWAAGKHKEKYNPLKNNKNKLEIGCWWFVRQLWTIVNYQAFTKIPNV